MAYLQSLSLTHEDIRTKNIFITRDGEYKVNYDPSRIVAYQQLLRGKSLPEHKYLLSPELLGALYEEVPEPQFNHVLADVFAVGMVLLAACTLNDIDDIYNWHTMTIEANNLAAKLNWVRSIYSERVYKLLDRMLRLDHTSRPHFVALEDLVGHPNSSSHLNTTLTNRRVSARYDSSEQSTTPKKSRAARPLTPNKSAGKGLPNITEASEVQGPTYGLVPNQKTSTPKGGRSGGPSRSPNSQHKNTLSDIGSMRNPFEANTQTVNFGQKPGSPSSKFRTSAPIDENAPKPNIQVLREREREYLFDRKTGKHRKGVIVKYYSDGSRYEGEMKGKMRDGRGIYYYRNGDIFAGHWLNDKFHGQGAYLFANGERFEGELVEGLKCGFGTYYYSNLNKYEGEWRDDMKNGKGIFEFHSTNERYEGEWQNGERHGLGTFCFATGDKYVGNWIHSEKSGNGLIVYANGAQFDGQWKSNKPNGRGVMKYVNGDNYDGNWVSGVKAGLGVYFYADGSKFEGEWEHDEKNGTGTFYHSKGDKYIGQWRGGVKNGVGLYNYKDGSVYDGEWEGDMKNGRGMLKLIDGTLYDGSWVNGERNGEGRLTLPNNDVYTGEFMGDKMHGYGVYHWQNGNIYEGEWENNMMNGHGRFTMRDGDSYEGIWENQKLVSVKK